MLVVLADIKNKTAIVGGPIRRQLIKYKYPILMGTGRV